MHTTNQTLRLLLEKYKTISLLNKINGLLDWDMNVNLPSKAAEARGRQMALITKLLTHAWTEPEFQKLLQVLNDKPGKLNLQEKAILRNINQAVKLYVKVPEEIIIERTQLTSEAFMAWQKAKLEDKFVDFLPFLERIVKINQIIAEHLGYNENPYDALLDLYEPELTTQFCREIFEYLQPKLTALIGQITSSKIYQQKQTLIGKGNNYPTSQQENLLIFVLKRMGFDFEAGRVDVSMHPFESSIDLADVRITTFYHADNLTSSLSSSMHEGGHGLYEQNINPEFNETPLQGGVSYAIHESQSRFWENQVGRSEEFLAFLTPTIQALYPTLGNVSQEAIIRLFNDVKPGLIRIEADEITYCLHIILRFELEEALINNRVKVAQLPELWREKMKHYLKIKPETDKEGVLQDVHWSLGYFGYFPSYALGNLYASQIAQAMRKDFNVSENLASGELGQIRSWLKDSIYQFGSLYYPDELIKKISGERLNPQYYIDYLKNKYSKLFNLGDSSLK